MKIKVLILVLIQINRIQAQSSSDSALGLLDLCQNASSVNYENYSDLVTQNCGCENAETCIRKCCQQGFFHNFAEAVKKPSGMDKCAKHDSGRFSVPFYDGERKIGEEVDNFLIGLLNCSDLWYIKVNETDPSKIFFIQNGSLYYPHYKLTLGNQRYCVDEDDGLTAYLCQEPEATMMEIMVHVTGKVISVPFLMATGIVYTLLPERNLHKAALIVHVFSLAVGNAFLAIGQYAAIDDDTLCFCLGYSILLLMVASFFWMNVICIDIWLAFSGLRGFDVQDKVNSKTFAIASLYAWGFPAINVLIVFLLNTFVDEDEDYHPGIGVTTCFLKDGLPTKLFYFGPIFILILINIVLFILTALNIQKDKKKTKILGGGQSRKHSSKHDDKFKLYWKLLFVMGLNPVVNTHIIQLIAWLLGQNFSHAVAVYVWYYKDFSHAVYGILISVIFVYEKKIWSTLRERYPCRCKCIKNSTKKTVKKLSNTNIDSDPTAIRLRGISNKGADVP